VSVCEIVGEMKKPKMAKSRIWGRLREVETLFLAYPNPLKTQSSTDQHIPWNQLDPFIHFHTVHNCELS